MLTVSLAAVLLFAYAYWRMLFTPSTEVTRRELAMFGFMISVLAIQSAYTLIVELSGGDLSLIPEPLSQLTLTATVLLMTYTALDSKYHSRIAARRLQSIAVFIAIAAACLTPVGILISEFNREVVGSFIAVVAGCLMVAFLAHRVEVAATATEVQ